MDIGQLHPSTRRSGKRLKDRLPTFGKKWFAQAGLECKFCLRKGHTRVFCPAAPYVPPAADKIPFVEGLLSKPRVKTNTFVGMSPEAVLQRVSTQGAEWNEGNPWVESDRIYDRLPSRLCPVCVATRYRFDSMRDFAAMRRHAQIYVTARKVRGSTFHRVHAQHGPFAFFFDSRAGCK